MPFDLAFDDRTLEGVLKRLCPIRRVDADRRMVYAEVYAPGVMDTYGEFMTAQDIELMAHRFMQLPNLSQVIDTNHDNKPNGSYPVESFIARTWDPDFTEGSWVLGSHIPRDDTWTAVLKGDLNNYSFEALVWPVELPVEVVTIRDHVGATKSDKGSDHTHLFYVQVNEAGLIIGGRTSPGPDGHVHTISRASYTDKASTLDGAEPHSHRYDLF